MAINIENETLIRIGHVPAWCEDHIGQRTHISTVHRWRQRGARGVKLETILVGGTRYTSSEALQRFFTASTAAADGHGSNAQIAPTILGRAHQQAEASLEADGI